MSRKFASRPFTLEWALFLVALACTLAGIAMRFYALGDAPYGIYHDEAFYGLDAVSVLNGEHPIFFTANNGREPFYIYFLTLTVGLFGRTAFGLRLAAAILGTLTIPTAYLLGRALFNHRIGLMTMVVSAVTFWPLALSRVSFRAGALPLLIGLAIALGWLAFKRRSVWLAALGGIAYGLTFNTYTASRVTPLALVLFAIVAFIFYTLPIHWGAGRREKTNNDTAFPTSTLTKLVLTYLIAAAIVLLPLALYAFAHPDQVFAREGQVSIFETEGGNPVANLFKHAALALGMFGFQGDSIARHNLPGRPVFDLWTFVFFGIGLGVLVFALIRKRLGKSKTEKQLLGLPRIQLQLAAAFIIIWLGVTIVPTLLAEDTPHYLRAIAMLPVLWLVPAVGFEAVLQRWPRTLTYVLVVIALIGSTLLTGYDYFVRYINLPVTHYYFEAAATYLADEINKNPTFSNRIDNRLWDNFASLRFLVENREGAGDPTRVQLAVWPYEPEDVRAQVAALPENSVISAEVGPLAQGDLETTPYSLYTLYRAEPAATEPVTAVFGEAVELRGVEAVRDGESVRIRLGWSVAGPVDLDYRVFVHVLINGEIVDQHDGEPLNAQYHFTWLTPGDILNDVYTLAAGEQVRVGVVTPEGALVGEPVVINVNSK